MKSEKKMVEVELWDLRLYIVRYQVETRPGINHYLLNIRQDCEIEIIQLVKFKNLDFQGSQIGEIFQIQMVDRLSKLVEI